MKRQNETYTEEGFIVHFDLCVHALDLWNSRMGTES